MKNPLIAARVFNTPLLIHDAKAAAFLRGFGHRLVGDFEPGPELRATDDPLRAATPFASVLDGAQSRDLVARERGGLMVSSGVAVIPVTGVLVHRGAWLGESSGQTSYEGLRAQIDAAAGDPEVRAVALEIDSHGGEVAGIFDLADRIRAVRQDKPVHAYVADHALSAAYAIASQADRIVMSRTALVGSIGVIMLHADFSGALEREGVAVTLIRSGAHKAAGNPYEALPEGVLAKLTGQADELRDLFAETVGRGRGARLGAAAALKTEADVFSPARAIEMGLADEVADPRAAFAAFVAKVSGGASPSQGRRSARASARRRASKLNQSRRSAMANTSKTKTSPAAKAGRSCPITPQAGENLGNVLNTAIDEQATEDRDRAAIIQEMGDAAGIEASTVNQILAGEINCPPLERLDAFAGVLELDVDDLVAAAEEDGCDYSDGEGEAEAESEGGEATANTPVPAPAAAASGTSAERERISAILTAPAAEGRMKLAQHLAFKTDMSAEDAVAALAADDRKAGAGALSAAMAGADTTISEPPADVPPENPVLAAVDKRYRN
ncbi:hypothetical protein DDZ14_08480 [Maritimibacter sp. 55A14]|uniref:S49 family peptidase n=1 Tax=Maritimibacter sp. 55A14 TaxID=2174844 RepID=UPI000D61B44B|nr:S49 family peptidase [Maritimibacter sp. 55A14]PWE32772.1 hypothetical protein DDZ14_08480 [Maritimibacter sp. 55A14]